MCWSFIACSNTFQDDNRVKKCAKHVNDKGADVFVKDLIVLWFNFIGGMILFTVIIYYW